MYTLTRHVLMRSDNPDSKEPSMQHKPAYKTTAAAVAITLLLAATGPVAWADGDTVPAKPMALRKIMRDLGKNMQVVTDGISREDWELVARTAPLIAEHPQPPLAEKTRILAFVGTDVGKFRANDHKTHQAAQALRQAATQQDGPAVISSFATLQASCLACHQSFRKSFQAHFYGIR